MAPSDAHEPDAVVVDIRMPPTQTTEGLDAAVRIHEDLPGIAVLALSQCVEARNAVALRGDGGGRVGYVRKSGSPMSPSSAKSSSASAAGSP